MRRANPKKNLTPLAIGLGYTVQLILSGHVTWSVILFALQFHRAIMVYRRPDPLICSRLRGRQGFYLFSSLTEALAELWNSQPITHIAIANDHLCPCCVFKIEYSCRKAPPMKVIQFGALFDSVCDGASGQSSSTHELCDGASGQSSSTHE